MGVQKDAQIILAARNIKKSFYGNTVLEGVSITCKKGVALALVGENGAGKSTLMNIISGGLRPDAGSLEFENQEITLSSSKQAKNLGISFVHQELSLFPYLSVGENILLGIEDTYGFGILKQRNIHVKAAEILKELQCDIDVNILVQDLSPAQRQMVEIAKAWAMKPKVLILDEPTSSLSKSETDNLFCRVNDLKKLGVSIILITHRMDEIFQICDEAMVLKDGRLVATVETKSVTKDDLIRLMVGREITRTFPQRECPGEIPPAMLELSNVQLGNRLKNIHLQIPRGRVIGIGGLEGQGQRELARALFGITPFTSGDVILGGKKVHINSPHAAMKHKIGFISDDRKLEGLVLPLSIEKNIEMLVLDKISAFGFINRKKERNESEEGVRQLAIKTPSTDLLVRHLSGGNQQKVIFAKWLKMNPHLLILHEPTRGVDVQSKIEIYHLIRDLTARGMSIILFTSDMIELIGMSDWIHIMYEGSLVGCLSGSDATEEKIMALSSGQSVENK
jgi:ABC-type sugar transport system ATPase subunit